MTTSTWQVVESVYGTICSSGIGYIFKSVCFAQEKGIFQRCFFLNTMHDLRGGVWFRPCWLTYTAIVVSQGYQDKNNMYTDSIQRTKQSVSTCSD